MSPQEIKDMIVEANEEALFLDSLDGNDFDVALIGVAERAGGVVVASYDHAKVIAVLMNKHEMDDIDAQEWYDYNIVSAWVGENTPIFINDYRG